MSCDWKESAIKRKDFRRSKETPEIAKKGKSKKKPTHKLIIEDYGFGFYIEPEDYVFGKYKNKTGAEQALKSLQNNTVYNKYKMYIEEI